MTTEHLETISGPALPVGAELHIYTTTAPLGERPPTIRADAGHLSGVIVGDGRPWTWDVATDPGYARHFLLHRVR